MIEARSSCNEACARATASFIRALLRLALHLHGWAMWSTLTAIAAVTGIWIAWDYIQDAWDTILDWWWR